jgi:hypothetical protein
MMVPEIILCASAVPALVNEYANWRRIKENAPDAIARRALKEASRIHARCWDATRCQEPGRGLQMIDECTLDLLRIISVVPYETAFLLLNHRDRCLEAVRNPRNAVLGPVPRHRRA